MTLDQMAALSHLRALIRAAKTKNDVEALHKALEEMLRFVAALPMMLLFAVFGRRVVNAIQFSGIK